MSYKTPAAKECFQAVAMNSPFLDIDAKKKFHTIVVKLLYFELSMPVQIC
jgi:hypothetical protein